MFEQAAAPEPRNAIGDWGLRAAITLAFTVFGAEKFQAHSMWPEFLQQVGWGQWFRYVTGAVEILGGLLVLIPWTATAGLALLAGTMAGAAVIHIFVLGHSGNCVIPVVFLTGLAGLWWSRWDR